MRKLKSRAPIKNLVLGEDKTIHQRRQIKWFRYTLYNNSKAAPNIQENVVPVYVIWRLISEWWILHIVHELLQMHLNSSIYD